MKSACDYETGINKCPYYYENGSLYPFDCGTELWCQNCSIERKAYEN